jgi:RluA family pseudouridine synthase
LIFKLLRKKQVVVFRNDEKLKVDLGFRIKAFDKIIVFENKIECKPNSYESYEGNDFIENNKIWENKDYVVIYKPAGLASQKGLGIKESVDNICKGFYIVHRLDKDTEGLMLLGKNVRSASKIADLFKMRKVQKYYICQMDGILKKKVIVNQPIMKKDQKRVIDVNGQQAITEFTPLHYIKNTTVVLAKPITGRTHQIRVHSEFLGLSLVGDSIYNSNYNKKDSLALQAFGLNLNKKWFFSIINLKYEIDQTKLINYIFQENKN